MRFSILSFSAILLLVLTSVSLFQNKTSHLDEASIGNQIWMSKNLNTATFKNGDSIPEAKSKEDWVKAASLKQPAWCYYDNNEKNSSTHGKLYNWYAINDARGIAPVGWRIPTDQDWNELIDYLGGVQLALIKLKTSKEWKRDGNGNNSSGFSAFPSGYRSEDGSFKTIGWYTAFWCAEENNPQDAWVRSLFYTGSVEKHGLPKASGFSVRCVKSKE